MNERMNERMKKTNYSILSI